MAEQSSMVWDLSSYFPAFDGPEYRAHRDGLKARLEDLMRDADAIGELKPDTAAAWCGIILRHEEIMKDYSHLSSYLGCLWAADARNEAIKREQERLTVIAALYRKAMIPFQAALRTADDAAFEALASQPQLRDVCFWLERSRHDAKYSMQPALEVLNADLFVDGIAAWARLYNTLAGLLEFDLAKPDGTTERVPMAQKNTLLNDPDPAIRKATLEGSNKAWEQHADTIAACLNSIAGTRLTLNRHRGVAHFLDLAMFQSAVSRETIECMWSVIASHREVPWKYLRRKAKLIGRERLGFQDLTAPLPTEQHERYGWKQGTETVRRAFGSRYPGLEAFAAEMLAKRHVESEKRPGKRPGAFCTSSGRTLESRVYMTYGGSISDMQTLAHELGHAWHNRVMRDMRPLAHLYPMTLAETASTFAEDILTRSLLGSDATPPSMKAQLLDTLLESAATFLLNIHMRYIFEVRFHEERTDGEVPVSRLKQLMLDAQRECYGDTLEESELDPWFWASKLHFYITGITFYNFPYTFGYLFSRGLSARFAEEGSSFLPKYEELLRLTGSDTAENVAARSIGVDLTKPEYWEKAIASIAREVEEFEAATSTP